MVQGQPVRSRTAYSVAASSSYTVSYPSRTLAVSPHTLLVRTPSPNPTKTERTAKKFICSSGTVSTVFNPTTTVGEDKLEGTDRSKVCSSTPPRQCLE